MTSIDVPILIAFDKLAAFNRKVSSGDAQSQN